MVWMIFSMHAVRNTPMLIRGSDVHNTRISTQPVVMLQNQPPNRHPAMCQWQSPLPPPPLPPDHLPQNPPPYTPCLLLYRWSMILITLTVPVRAQKRCVAARPSKCLMRNRSWDGVHRVGIDLTVLHAIVLAARRNFAQAPDFHDFEPGII